MGRKIKQHTPTIRLSIQTSPIVAGLPMTVGISITDLDLNLATGSIQWGDGITQTWGQLPPTSLTHTYAAAGAYLIAADVKDTLGMRGSTSASITVMPPTPLPPATNPPPDPPPVDPPPVGGIGAALAFSDFTYLGCFTLPGGTINSYSNSFGGLAGRRDATGPSIFFVGNLTQSDPIGEFRVPATLYPTPAIADVNIRASIKREWGSPDLYNPATGRYGIRKNTSGPDDSPIFGIHYFNNKLFWVWYSRYNSAFNELCLGYSTLNDATGVQTAFGGWRPGPSYGSKFCGTDVYAIPQAFADSYVGGRRLMLGSQFTGGPGSAYGMVGIATVEPTGATPTNDSTNQTDYGLPTDAAHTFMAFDVSHRQPVTIENFQRKCCGWDSHGLGTVLTSNAAVGTTQIAVADTARFAHVSVAGAPGSDNGGQPTNFYGVIGDLSASPTFFGYNARSTASGPGFLTGIPTSGPWSIQTPLLVGQFIGVGKYDTLRGGSVAGEGLPTTAAPVFGPTYNGWIVATGGHLDYTRGGIWINCPVTGKQGVIFVGDVVDFVSGYAYPSDNMPHSTYGLDGCPHGHDFTRNFGATGPTCTTRHSAMWIYDQADLARVMTGALSKYAIAPKAYSHARLVGNNNSIQNLALHSQNGMGGMWYDPVASRLYVCEKNVVGGNTYPAIHVFQLPL